MSSIVKRATVAVALCTLAPLFAPSLAAAKTPGSVHCFGVWCHRVNTVDEMDGMVGRRGMLVASYYDDCRRDRFNPCGLTSSGAVFRPDLADNAASPIFPDGTVLLTYNHKTKLAAVVRVTNAGPYRGDRKLDVSRATAESLGFLKRGVTELEVVVVRSPELHEVRYSKRRTYAPVPGFLGRFATFDDAHDAAVARLRLETPAVRVAAARAQSDGKDRNWPDTRSHILPSTPALIEQPLIATAPDVVANLAPDVVLVAGHAQDIDAVPVTELRSTNGEVRTLADRIAEFIAAARSAARFHRTDSEALHLGGRRDVGGVSLTDRARDFIRAAQAHARLGAGGGTTYSGLTTPGEPSS